MKNREREPCLTSQLKVHIFLSKYIFSTFYTTLPHKRIKDKLIEDTLLNSTIPLTRLVMQNMPFFTSEDQKRFTLWSCVNVSDDFTFLLDKCYVKCSTK